jgi:uncharacterized protein (TIGR03083 family)
VQLAYYNGLTYTQVAKTLGIPERDRHVPAATRPRPAAHDARRRDAGGDQVNRPYDDETAALLALDALEPDEQADAGLRIGTFPPGLADAVATLAEDAVVDPPAELRADTLARATVRRPAGRPLGAARPCTPAETFDRTVADLDRLLGSLTAAEWNAPAHPDHGRVRDLVAHLVGVERLVLRWLEADESAPELADHVAATRPVVAELADTQPREVARQWYEAARAVAAAAAGGDPARAVRFHDITLSMDVLLVMRTFELWAHATDVCLATGRPVLQLDSERMTTLSAELMRAIPVALAYRGSTAPGRSARFVLTGPAGGSYTVPLAPETPAAEPGVTIVTDPVDLCRVAARRLDPAELDVTIDGDHRLAEIVLASVGALARD